MSDNKKLQELEIAEEQLYHERKALIFFEAAVNEILDQFDYDEALKIYETYREYFEE